MTTANGQEYHVGGFIFTAGFDSGNLGGVALEEEDEDEEVVAAGRDPSPTLRPLEAFVRLESTGRRRIKNNNELFYWNIYIFYTKL